MTDYVELPGSHLDAPKEAATAIASVRAVNPSEQIEVSLYLKDRATDPLLQQPPMTADEAAAESSSGTVLSRFERSAFARVQGRYRRDIAVCCRVWAIDCKGRSSSQIDKNFRYGGKT